MTFLSRALTGLTSRIRDRVDRKWLDAPNGCCDCGTGGPYYVGSLKGHAHHGHREPVTRYLYTGACNGTPAGRVDWASCSRHPIDWLVPLVDYGRDVVVTYRQAEADAAKAWRAAS